MKNLIGFCILCSAVLVWGGESIAIAKNVKGTVQVKRDGTYLNVVKGSDLQAGDILQTSDNSAVGLTFNDGSVLSIGAKSMMELNKYLFKPSSNEYDFDVTLKKGTAAFESGKIGKLAPQKVAFRVPQGSIGIRGTKFLVDVEE
ncbi:MAG: FecR domain-containing protein [Sulfuricurvum sp.]|uniref:FecR family protein n=1 Tax=Sulfuricurvum sp. TaxID=2025608 RepID=UPI0026347A6D|nr:FecR domain-containing protein [Sulfuricurvum sp.]MDD2370151.1 FecR domain-containing protein [Sulfuricurvum sp.]MDD2950645.1 FecR domain-containing protein [Sulfuricurvum sp.]MDD5116990.1 FecR domain-containing protein [Sulfuricurvum sp.]